MIAQKSGFSLLCLLLGLFFMSPKAVCSDRWVEVRSAHFTVFSNAGEIDARRIANQIEEIRAVFLQTFPALRLDPGKPTSVIAVKNEDSMKILLPDYWLAKDRTRPTGVFMASLDRNFAVLRTDIGGSRENPYHNLYYDYTGLVLRLNFPSLPTWFDVGLCEYFANTLVGSGEIGVGHVSRAQLQYLDRLRLRLIPLNEIFSSDMRSPLLNVEDKAFLFHAEAWAIIHYMLNEPDARKGQWFAKYLKAYEDTNDSEAAAKQAFGDLNHLQAVIESYSRQTSFHFQSYKPQAPISPQAYPVREMTSAEALTVQGEFLAHINHAAQAKEMFNQALEQQPDLAAAHVGIGYVDYLQHDNDGALAEFNKAIGLDQLDFRPYHFRALLLLRTAGYTKDFTPQIIANLQKVIALNPEFAPAYGFLSVAYRQQDDTKPKSFDAAVRASSLEPANYNFRVDIGDALLAINHDQDAIKLLDTMQKAARTPSDKNLVESFAKRLTARQNPSATTGKTSNLPARATSSAAADDLALQAGGDREYGLQSASSQTEEGLIQEATCTASSITNVRFAILGKTLLLTAADSSKITLLVAGKISTVSAVPCEQWKGRKAKITFIALSDEKNLAEIISVDFL